MKKLNSKTKKNNKMEALKYLVKNGKVRDEWMGAGMYEAVVEIMNSNDEEIFTKDYLDKLLNKASKN
jgi:hypothetical protein